MSLRLTQRVAQRDGPFGTSSSGIRDSGPAPRSLGIEWQNATSTSPRIYTESLRRRELSQNGEAFDEVLNGDNAGDGDDVRSRAAWCPR